MKKTLVILVVILLLLTVILSVTEQEAKTDGGSSARHEPTGTSGKKTDVSEQITPFCQYPTLPTGCEATAAAMLLQFYGEKITPEEFAGSWLPCSQCFYSSGEALYGPDPEECFVGDPFAANGYGCYAPVIVKAVNENCAGLRAAQVTGDSLDALCREYVDRGEPLLVWATMAMKESKPGKSWLLPDGRSFTWISGEHCMVLCGSDDRFFYFADPQSGSTVGYERRVAEQRFGELGKQAVRCIGDAGNACRSLQ